ncbi:helix-turn-helix domain-containing protein [Kitasatospora sp. NPDC096147]|uniref:helix-turn-helix domain-containing protein n=1 Tax=Kitasatospora sp. NPDC096147 TaxID=3364093 RepID=UPI003817C8A4
MMKVGDVAEKLQVPVSWIYDNWQREQIPFKKVGNRLRCRPADLERWIENLD